jgi:cytochrome c oxidase cbb3-type subunit 3
MSSRCPELLAMMLAALAALTLPGCYREHRPTTASPAASSVDSPSSSPRSAARGPVQAGNRYDENAYAVSQGRTWYRAYNCNGCHAQGGGDMGPALMDAGWRYGGDPASIYASIADGRPNGMPAFRTHVTEDQIWQLVAYVRSLSGQLEPSVASSRSDTLQAGKGEARRDKETPVQEQVPGVAQ